MENKDGANTLPVFHVPGPVRVAVDVDVIALMVLFIETLGAPGLTFSEPRDSLQTGQTTDRGHSHMLASFVSNVLEMRCILG